MDTVTEDPVQSAVVTAEEAMALVLQERAQRGQTCGELINKVLAKYRCRMEWIEVRRSGQLVEAKWQIVPLE